MCCHLNNVIIFLWPAVSIIKLAACHAQSSTVDRDWFSVRWPLGWWSTWWRCQWRRRQIILWSSVTQCTLQLLAWHSINVHVFTLHHFNIDQVWCLHTVHTSKPIHFLTVLVSSESQTTITVSNKITCLKENKFTRKSQECYMQQHWQTFSFELRTTACVGGILTTWWSTSWTGNIIRAGRFKLSIDSSEISRTATVTTAHNKNTVQTSQLHHKVISTRH